MLITRLSSFLARRSVALAPEVPPVKSTFWALPVPSSVKAVILPLKTATWTSEVPPEAFSTSTFS